MVWRGVGSKGVSPLVIFESDRFDHGRYIGKCFQSPSNMPMTYLETTRPSSNTVQCYTSMQNHWNGEPTVTLRLLMRTIGFQIVLIRTHSITVFGMKMIKWNIGCNKVIVPCTLYRKKRIFYLCNRSNRLI